MRSSSGVRLEWFAKTGAVLLAAILVLLTLNSMQLLSKTRSYLEGELEARLTNLKEIISPELSGRLGRSSAVSEYLRNVALRESLERIRLINQALRTVADSRTGPVLGGRDSGLGISGEKLNDVWGGLTVVSPVYESGGGLVRSLYFPVYDRSGRPSVICELTLGASHIKDLTELGTTHFVLKSVVVLVFITGLLYMLRTLVVSQKKIVQAASGANIGQQGPRATDDVTFVINSFQTIVKELKEKERELRELKDKAEEKARLIESYNESVLKNVQSGVMTFGADGKVKTVNPAAVEILGLGGRELEGSDAAMVFEGGPWLSVIVDEALKQARVKRRGEGGFIAPDGSRRWLGAGTSTMLDDDGSLAGAILVFTDLSEVKQLRDKMELRERMTLLGEMSAGIAHELRNPMAVISGYAKLLARKMEGDPETLEAIESMQEEIGGMDDIIREFMSFARPAELNLADTDIASVLDDAARSAGAAFAGADISLEMDDDIPPVFGDQLLLRQAFINIMQNGIEAMDGRGVLTIMARMAEPATGSEDAPPGGRMLRIDFSDKGRGIPEADLGKIFTPFFTTKSKGTGLGLALVQKILVYHGGRASVKSSKDGGTMFSVFLPVGPYGEEIDG